MTAKADRVLRMIGLRWRKPGVRNRHFWLTEIAILRDVHDRNLVEVGDDIGNYPP